MATVSDTSELLLSLLAGGESELLELLELLLKEVDWEVSSAGAEITGCEGAGVGFVKTFWGVGLGGVVSGLTGSGGFTGGGGVSALTGSGGSTGGGGVSALTGSGGGVGFGSGSTIGFDSTLGMGSGLGFG
ncbi:hypothetical protein H1P_1740006 [Hyella patelloides LEGE 07179]|uniref:Uncharacterized protein n=1 Tax=Hyella patelloides LEGE 07179 TaxID=945734 RepID=A0A563VNG2_9CYAN|nr:hypothetical protein H1P_1740006 [Hyella patelloides LEGE 07179]